jgi:hypothetical protein
MADIQTATETIPNADGQAALEAFCDDARAILKSDPSPKGQEAVRKRLLPLLTDRDFLDAFAGPGTARGGHRLYTDIETGFAVVIYIGLPDRGESPPHDHGLDWAIYGQSRLRTDMRDFRIVSGDAWDPDAELEETAVYHLDPGDARLYLVGDIHSINPMVDCVYVRVAGSPADHFTPVGTMPEEMARIWLRFATERPPRPD